MDAEDGIDFQHTLLSSDLQVLDKVKEAMLKISIRKLEPIRMLRTVTPRTMWRT
jgi:hypothetical protein